MDKHFLQRQLDISKTMVDLMERDFKMHYASVQLLSQTCQSLIHKLQERDDEIFNLRSELIELRKKHD